MIRSTECDVPVPGIFHFFGGIGTGIGKNWYRKKVSEPVSEKFGTGKKSGNWNQIYLVQKKIQCQFRNFVVPVSINHSMKAFSLCIYTFQILLSSYSFQEFSSNSMQIPCVHNGNLDFHCQNLGLKIYDVCRIGTGTGKGNC